ncbi:tyrosine recombinase XerD [Anaplasma platys]|uniref:Tyrosine recombinase XerD n=1 Tax=Anaplasma platys TaxID=949 RepID=A0A858PXK5_9RICK|nr:tyrosine-type recombinase/integrase [Anaplasma platys]QJC27298.1 tyrosine recombinase XerD [Anaplasma platys]
MEAKNTATVVRDWVCWLCEEKGYSAHTVSAYERDIKGFLASLDDDQVALPDLGEVGMSEFRHWIALRCREGKQPQSNARALSVVRNFYRYLYYKHGIKNNFPAVITSPISRRRLPKVLEKSQILEIIDESVSSDWSSRRDIAIVALLYGCGLRISEAVGLRFGNIEQEVLKICGKGKKERIIPLMPWVVKLLWEYVEDCPFHVGKTRGKDVIVFLGVKGQPLDRTYFAHRMKVLRRKMGLPECTTPHALRHSFATHMFLEGADIRVIQELLGHENLSTTQIYTHLDHKNVIENYRGFHPHSVKKDK